MNHTAQLYRRDSVFLVDLGDVCVLVDQHAGVMHAVNAAGAYAWTVLESEGAPDAFVAQLRDLDLIGDRPDGSVPPPVSVPDPDEEPRVLRTSLLLQVAASRPMHRGGWF